MENNAFVWDVLLSAMQLNMPTFAVFLSCYLKTLAGMKTQNIVNGSKV